VAEAAIRRRSFKGFPLPEGLLFGGVLALALPTLVSLASGEWTRDEGSAGPLILATGGWLLWRERVAVEAVRSSGNPWIYAVGLAAALATYVFGRAYDFMTLEAGGLVGVALAAFYSHFGERAVRRTLFAWIYLLAAVPAPQWVLDAATSPLKQFASWAATAWVAALGAPVARQGVTILVGPYQLLVADACSGLNSLVGLSAVVLLYIYLTYNGSRARALLLGIAIVPIAVAANIARIVALVLITYFMGDAAAQSFLHGAAGLLLFATALTMIFLLDRALGRRLAGQGRDL
jgi:exosortase